MDIADRLHHLMLRPGFQAREDQQTLLEGKQEIDRLRAILRQCMPGANAIDLGNGEFIGLYQLLRSET